MKAIPKISNAILGYTLMEIMVTMGIILVILIPLTRLQINVLQYGTFFQNTNALQDEARRALQKLTAELRSMAVSGTGAYPIAESAPTALSFYRDADQDGLTERIRYYLEGTDLKKGVIIPSGNPLTYQAVNEKKSVVVHGVYNFADEPIFQYYDHDYDGTSAALGQPIDVTAVRLIKLNLLIGAGDKTQDRMTLTTQVSLRNIKDNL